MARFLILLMSLVLVFSSCAAKKVLWDQLDIESNVPAKSFPSKAISSLSSLCSENVGSLLDEAEVVPTNSVKVPLLLLSVLLENSFNLPALLQQDKPSAYSRFNYSNTGSVPIYLKLGRLIYYS